MTLSDGEKLILMMLSEVYKHHKIKGEIDPDFVKETILHDQTWGFKWKYASIFRSPEETPPVVKETCDILDMYRLISASFKKLSAADQEKVKTNADPFDGYIIFRGFDFNNDDHADVVNYLVNSLEKYEEINPDLNSHSSGTLPHYLKMLEVLEPMKNPYPSDGLLADQLVAVLKG